MGIGDFFGSIGHFLTNRPGEDAQRNGLVGQGQAAGNFAAQGAQGYGNLGGQLGTQADYLRRIQSGQESVSAEQLRQGLQQNIAGQQAMAAGASPQNAPMAALMASRNAMQGGAGLAGQQALAGIQERRGATGDLNQMLLQQRQQDLNATLGGQQNATGAYGQIPIGQSWMDRFGGMVTGGASLLGLGGGKGGGQPQGGGNYRYGPQPGPNGQTTYVPPPPRY